MRHHAMPALLVPGKRAAAPLAAAQEEAAAL